MSDNKKPFTMKLLESAYKGTDGFVYRGSEGTFSLKATVEAMEKAEAERDTATAWSKVQQDALAAVTRERDEARVLYRDAEERYANEVRSHDTTMAERDEARAEVARLQDLHTRCAAFDDQPGPACVALAAKCAALREALGSMKHLMGWFWDEGMLDLHDEDCPHDDTCECDAAGQFNEAHAMARAALATDGEGT